jgi:signal transduction histidine kinase
MLREPLDVIQEETGRLEELARQFAVLGRPSTGPASDVDVRDLLERMLQSDVPAPITARVIAPDDVPLIRAHYDALQRAFRNLVRNAVEAMSDVDAAAPRELTVTIRRRADGITVAVADRGHGVPADRIDRLFEPDFTLKAGGTGLGLAVVRQAVAAHGGTVTARPRPGGGAEFIVQLPSAPPAAGDA